MFQGLINYWMDFAERSWGQVYQWGRLNKAEKNFILNLYAEIIHLRYVEDALRQDAEGRTKLYREMQKKLRNPPDKVNMVRVFRAVVEDVSWSAKNGYYYRIVDSLHIVDAMDQVVPTGLWCRESAKAMKAWHAYEKLITNQV